MYSIKILLADGVMYEGERRPIPVFSNVIVDLCDPATGAAQRVE
jgi:hypothetical protein